MPSPYNINIQLRAQADSASVSRATSQIKSALTGLNANVGVNTAGAVSGLARVRGTSQAAAAALRSVRSAAGDLNATINLTAKFSNDGANALSHLGEQAGLAARRFVAFSVVAGAILTAVRGIREGVRAAVEFDLAMNKVEQVSLETKSTLGALRRDIADLSTGLGVSSASLAETAITLKQAGLTAGQTRDALKALALTDLAPAFDNIKQSTEGLIASMRQFNLNSKEFESTLSSINAVSAQFAVESSDIVTAIQKAGGAFKLTAGDMKSGSEALNEFVSLFTSVRATTRESADSIATGLRTVFTRFQRQDTVDALKDLNINLRYTRDEAKALGDVNLTDQFVGAFEAVKRLSEGLAGLRETDPRYAQVVEQLGGYRQISRVVPLLKEFRTAQEALNVAQAGQLSLSLAAEKRQESLANKTEKLKEQYLDFFRKVVDSKGFQGLADSLLGVATSFAKVLDFARPLLPLLIGIAGLKIAKNLAGITSEFSRAFVAPPGASLSNRPGRGRIRFAKGDVVPGSGDGDTVPAYLTPGEFVIKKSSARKIGYERLRELNERPQKFANGGKVGPSTVSGFQVGRLLPQHRTVLGLGLSSAKDERGLIKDLPDELLKDQEAFSKYIDTLTEANSSFVNTRGRKKVNSYLARVGVDPSAIKLSSVSSGSRSELEADFDSAGRNRKVLSQKITLDSSIESVDLLDHVAAHELGHALHLGIGPERLEPALKAARGDYVSGLRSLRKRGNLPRSFFAYTARPDEVAAELIGSAFSGSVAAGFSKVIPAEYPKYEANRDRILDAISDLAGKRKKYARGSRDQVGAGYISGSGNNDSENALLMPGEFVLNKDAVNRIGVPTLRAWNQGNGRKYAKGSTSPVGISDVRAVVAEFESLTGLLVKSLVSKIRVASQIEGLPTARGQFSSKSGVNTIQVGLSNIKSLDQLRRTLFHELGHAIDLKLGEGRLASSTQNSIANRVGANYGDRILRSPAYRAATKEQRAYLSNPGEGFAEAITEALAGGKNAKGLSFTSANERAGIIDLVIKPLAAKENFGFIDPAYATKRRAQQSYRFFDEDVPPASKRVSGSGAARIASLRKKNEQNQPVVSTGQDVASVGLSEEEAEALLKKKEARAGKRQLVKNRRESDDYTLSRAFARKLGLGPEEEQPVTSSGSTDDSVSVLKRLSENQRKKIFYGEKGEVDKAAQERLQSLATKYGIEDYPALESLYQRRFVSQILRGKVKDDGTKTIRARTAADFAVREYLKTNGGSGTVSIDALSVGADGISSESRRPATEVSPEALARRDEERRVETALRHRGIDIPKDRNELLVLGRSLGLPGKINSVKKKELTRIVSLAAIGDKVPGYTDVPAEERRSERGPGRPRKNPAVDAAGGGRPPRRPPAPPSGAPEDDYEDEDDKPKRRRKRAKVEREVYQPVKLSELGQFGKEKGLSPAEFAALTSQVYAAAQKAGRTEDLKSGRASVLLNTAGFQAPPGGVGPYPGAVGGFQFDQSSKGVADGIRQVAFRDLPQFGRELGLGVTQFSGLISEVRALANQSGNLTNLLDGLAKAVVQVRGGLVSVRGFAGTTGDPVAKYADKFEQDFVQGTQPGQTRGLGGFYSSRDPVPPISTALVRVGGQVTDEEKATTEARLKAERIRFGQLQDQSRYESELLLYETKREKARKQSGSSPKYFVTPELSALLEENSSNALPGGSRPDPRAAARDRQRIKSQQAPAGEDRAASQLALKESLYQKIDAGTATGSDIDAARGVLSNAQFGQVLNRYQKANGTGGNFDPRLAGFEKEELLKTKGVKFSQLANFSKNSDGSDTLTGGIAAERATELANKRIAARGGAKALSDTTQAAIRETAATEESARARREFVSAQTRLLAVLRPEMSAMERHKQAEDDAAKAMAGLAQVARDAKGRILGLASTVTEATAAGVAAPGAGGRGYAVGDAVRGRLSRVGEFLSNNKLTRLNERLSASSGPLAGVGAVAFGAGALFAGDSLRSSGGSAEDAVKRTGGAAGYIRSNVAGGALEGAGAGAGLGFAAFGPLGAVIGGAVGAVGGFISSLRDAEKDIRNARISNALNELADKMSVFATGLADDTTLASIRSNTSQYLQGANERAREEATGTFSGFDSKRFIEAYRADTRKEFGNLLPQVVLGLNKQAEKLGRDNPNLSADELNSKLLEGGGGVNRELIRLVAELRGVPVRQLSDEFKKQVISAQNSAKLEEQGRVARAQQERQANDFGRLLVAIQSASDALSGLQREADGLAQVLDGVVSAGRVDGGARSLESGFGRPDVLRPLSLIGAATGDTSLLTAGTAINKVAEVLSSTLASEVANRSPEEEGLGTRIGPELYRRLGYDSSASAPQDIQRVVATVLSGINSAEENGRGEGGIRKEIGADATKFAEKLLGPLTEPLKAIGGEAAKLIEDGANRIADGLTNIAQRVQQTGQLYDQLAELSTSNFRQATQFSGDAAGRSFGALDNVPLSSLEYGFNSRQQRLSFGDSRAFDPNAIGDELNSVRAQLVAARETQQKAFETTGGRGDSYLAASKNVAALSTRASNLEQALKNLANVADRNAVIQERLNRLQQESEGRRGIVERLATADPQERLRINRGFALAGQAAQVGKLDDFSDEERRLIIETLRSSSGVTLTGFKGAPRADDLLKNLLDNSFGGLGRLTAPQQAEEQKLKAEALARGTTGEAAIQKLITAQEQGSEKLYANLLKQNEVFLNRLEKLLTKRDVAVAENDLASAGARLGKLNDRKAAFDVLSSVGVRTDDQLTALRAKSGEIEGLRAAIAAEQATKERVSETRKRIGEFGPESGVGINDFLARSGLDVEQAARVRKTFDSLQSEADVSDKRAKVIFGTSSGSAERAAGLDAINRGLLDKALQQEFYRDTSAPVREARGRLNGISGVNPLAIEDALRDPKSAEQFKKALSSFDGEKIVDFNKKLREATDEVERLRSVLSTLTGAGAATVTRANGGSIFRPQGTDTVPAMLTPGEYVINRKSASANAALLHRINEARGPVNYLAGGGPVIDPDPTKYKKPDLSTLSPIEREMYGRKIIRDKEIEEEVRRRAEEEDRKKSRVAPDPVTPAQPLPAGEFERRIRAEKDRLDREERERQRISIQKEQQEQARRKKAEADEAKRKAFEAKAPERLLRAEVEANPDGQMAQKYAEQQAMAGDIGNRERLRREQRKKIEYLRDEFNSLGKGSDAQKAVYAKGRAIQVKIDKDLKEADERGISGKLSEERRLQELDRLRNRDVGDNAGGAVFLRAQTQNFNQQAGLGSGIRRAGDEGQLNVASRVLGVTKQDLDARAATDQSLQRFFARNVAGVKKFALGGPVFGSGTGDSVLSLLTPGEHVLSRSAVSNMGGHAGVQRFESGGPVRPAGPPSGGSRGQDELTPGLTAFAQGAGVFAQSSQQFVQAMTGFTQSASALAQAISSIPKTITVSGQQQVTVVVNGAEAMTKIMPEMQKLIEAQVRSSLNRVFSQQLPDAGVSIG